MAAAAFQASGWLNTDDLQLLVNLHKDAIRRDPGGEAETRISIKLSGLLAATTRRFVDIGCGSGASTLVLAQHLDAPITVVNFIREFLAKLETDAARTGAADRIKTLATSMDALPFDEAELQDNWAQGYGEVDTASAKMARRINAKERWGRR